MKLRVIHHYLVPVNIVYITHVKHCQNVYVTRRSRHYAIGIYHLLHSQYLRVKKYQWRNLQFSYRDIVKEQDDEICDICVWSINFKRSWVWTPMFRGEPYGIRNTEWNGLLLVIWNFRRIRQIGWGREFNSGTSSMTIWKHLPFVPAKGSD